MKGWNLPTFKDRRYLISMFHRAFFNSIIDKHQHMHFFIQHYISVEWKSACVGVYQLLTGDICSSQNFSDRTASKHSSFQEKLGISSWMREKLENCKWSVRPQTTAQQTCLTRCNRCRAHRQDSNKCSYNIAATVSISRFAFRGRPTVKLL